MTDQPGHELTWFPCYPDRILSSERWMHMKDFQRGWYWHLLLLMTRSKPLGLLRHDGRLWTLAGAHTRYFWESNCGLVLACFEERQVDGECWICSEPLLKVLHEQEKKYDNAVKRDSLGVRKRAASKASISSSASYSKEFEEVWEKNVWKKVSKKTASAAFEKAIQWLLALGSWPLAEPVPGAPAGTETKNQEPKAKSRNDATSFIVQAMEQFKNSDAGKANGLFDDYQPPFPASWLNGQRYLDDRKAWNRTEVTGKNAGATQTETSQEPGAKSRSNTLPDCPACSGTGWKQAGRNKVARCNCRLEKESRDAANTATEQRGDQ